MPDWQTDVFTDSYGPDAMAEEDLCRAVGEDLHKHYPGHPWMVGAMLQGGHIVIDIGYEKPRSIQNMAYLLHIKSLFEAGGQQKVMRAGGELLERFQLARDMAKVDASKEAKQNGFIADDHPEGAHALDKAKRQVIKIMVGRPPETPP